MSAATATPTNVPAVITAEDLTNATDKPGVVVNIGTLYTALGNTINACDENVTKKFLLSGAEIKKMIAKKNAINVSIMGFQLVVNGDVDETSMTRTRLTACMSIKAFISDHNVDSAMFQKCPDVIKKMVPLGKYFMAPGVQFLYKVVMDSKGATTGIHGEIAKKWSKEPTLQGQVIASVCLVDWLKVNGDAKKAGRPLVMLSTFFNGGGTTDGTMANLVTNADVKVFENLGLNAESKALLFNLKLEAVLPKQKGGKGARATMVYTSIKDLKGAEKTTT